MSKANRIAKVGRFSIILLTIFFWVSIVCAIIGKFGISLFATIGWYAVSCILVEYCIGGEIKKRIIMLLGIEAIQLIPYALIIATQSLIG